eukprot:844532-Rhodomonas_salina.1
MPCRATTVQLRPGIVRNAWRMRFWRAGSKESRRMTDRFSRVERPSWNGVAPRYASASSAAT